MTDLYLPGDLQGEGIDLIDRTEHVGVSHRTHIGTDVGLIVLEGHVPAVGDIDLGNMSCFKVHDLEFMGTVDDSIKFSSVGLDIVSHIP